MFACPACGRKYSSKPELAGKKIRCGGCGGGVRVPGGDAVVTAPTSSRTLKTFGADEKDQKPARQPRAGAPRAATSSAVGEPDEIDSLFELVTASVVPKAESAGVALSQAEMLERARQHAIARGAITDEPEIDKPVKKKKKKKKKGYFDANETLKLVAGLGVLVAILALLAWRLPGLRFPLGGLLCVVGFNTYLLGWAALKQLVAEEGAFKALMFRFLPPYQWWYVATHWSETQDYVAFFASGLMILALGGVIIKTSPIGKKTEQSEQAYQKAQRGTQPEPPSPMPAKAAGVAGVAVDEG